MKFKWAVLNVLAKWPDRRVTFAEIRREVGNILETGDRPVFPPLPPLGGPPPPQTNPPLPRFSSLLAAELRR